MALDDAERNKLDTLKQEEKEQAEKEVLCSFTLSLTLSTLIYLLKRPLNRYMRHLQICNGKNQRMYQ